MSSGFKLAQDFILVALGGIILIFHNSILDLQEKITNSRRIRIFPRITRDRIILWVGTFFIVIGFLGMAIHYK